VARKVDEESETRGFAVVGADNQRGCQERRPLPSGLAGRGQQRQQPASDFVLQEFVETWLFEPLALAGAEPVERFGPVLQRRNFQREESRSNFRGADAGEVDWPVVGVVPYSPDCPHPMVRVERLDVFVHTMPFREFFGELPFHEAFGIRPITIPDKAIGHRHIWREYGELVHNADHPLHLKEFAEHINTPDMSHAAYHVRRAEKTGLIRKVGFYGGWVAVE